jgi:glucose-1-phosphate thymidylyltransferase
MGAPHPFVWVMEIAKALILATDHVADRSWPFVPGTRHLFPVANRPIIFHNLKALREAGVLEATILADPEAGAALERAVGDGRDCGVVVHHAPWRHTAGLRGALAAARDFMADEPVLVQHGDALLRDRLYRHVSAFARERLDALALRLEQVTPGYLLSPRAVSMLLEGGGAVNPVASLRARGGRVRVQTVDGCLPCHGDVEALLTSNRCMLEGLASSVDPGSLAESTVHGAVAIHPTARITRSLLRGPVIIGPGAIVTDAYIGPYTSIGAGVLVEAAEIEHSIVLSDARLRFVGNRLESSVIGRGARIERGFALPAAMRVALGDGAEVILK